MKLYQQLIIKRYIKSFLTIFLALTLFFVGVDLVSGLDSLPKSANLKILYAINTFFYFFSYTFSLSLLFAMISTTISLIKENELVVIYSFGFSKREILKPFLYTIAVLILFFILLNNFSFFVSARQVANNILHYGKVSKFNANLFLKSQNKYIYIGELNKFKKEGRDIEIFETKDNTLLKVIKAKKGEFKGNSWLLFDVTITKIPTVKNSIENKKLLVTNKKELKTLQGFKPTIMNSLYEGAEGLDIVDSIEAIYLLKDKGINITAIKAKLYETLFFPFFSLFFAIFIFIKLPIQRRGLNLGFITSKLYFISLVSWGVFFILIKVTKNGAVPAEIGIILPIFLLALFSYYLFTKKLDDFA